MEQPFFKAKVVYDEQTDEHLLHLDEDWCRENDWKIGDSINWEVVGDQAIATNTTAQERKNVMKYVLVETVSIFRQRYVILAKSEEHARDEVTMMDHEFKEFSQLHLDEIINSSRILTEDQVIELCDSDNDYLTTWSREEKLKNLVNKLNYEV